MRITLIRHAPAIRPARTIYGATDYDADVSDNANKKQLIKNLGPVDIWASSSLKRAKQTASEIHKEIGILHNVVELREFNEQNLGVLEGTLRSESLDQTFPYWILGRNERPQAGDSFDDVATRSMAKLREIASQYKQYSHVVIVTHGNVIRSILASIL